MRKFAACLRACGPVTGLCLLTLMVFEPAFRFDFLFWDDRLNIVANPQLQSPAWRWPEIGWILSFHTNLRFMPVTWLVHLAICTVFGVNPAAYHLGLFVLHLVNTLLLYHLTLRLLSRFAGGSAPRAAIAFVTTAFWAVNPLRVETLGWCTALSYPLATMLALGSFHFYLGSIRAGGLRIRSCLWSFILNGLSVCAYPVSLGYAFCLPFFDRLFFKAEVSPWTNPRSAGSLRYWLSRILFVLPSLVITLATTRARLHPTGGFAASTGPVQAGLVLRSIHAIYAWFYLYLRQFWPFGLTPGHYVWTNPGLHWIYLPAFLCLLGILVLAWRRKSSPILNILAASLVLSAPMLGLMENPATPVDRYTYLPEAFFTLLLACLANRFWPQRLTSTARRAAGGSALVCLALIGWQSHAQLRIWKDSYALFAHLEAQPEIQAQPALQDHIRSLKAAQLLSDGRLKEALAIYDELVRREPENYLYWHQRGLTLHLLGQDAQALQSLRTAYALGHNRATWQLIQSLSAPAAPAKP